MKFFFDNNLSPHLAAGMKAFGEDVVHLTEGFAPNAADTAWLEYIGRNGIALITRDDAIRRRPAELAAFKLNKVVAFFLGGKNRTRCELIQQVVRNWPRIKEIAEKADPPCAFRIPPAGTKFDNIPL